uniref:Uncharacterized protein n=1 Tax=Anopheles stephensi TaxID=30069 RepID=A0A182YMC1_ANOST
MKQQLLLLLSILIGTSTSIDISCDGDFYCTVKHLIVPQFQQLPEQLLQRLTTLVVKQSYMPTLNVSTLHPTLPDLNLVNCEVEKLILPRDCALLQLTVEETIGGIETAPNRRLNFLSITKSHLGGLLAAIANMSALETIRLRRMHIPAFSLDVLQGKSKLFGVELNFDRMEALHLSPNRTCCETLSELDLSCNHFTALDLDLLSRLQALKKLRFRSNRIVTLNGTLELPNLLELDLASNRLQTLDVCRWKTESLRLLFLENNRIRHLFSCIEKLQNLISIRMSNNLLTALDMAPFAKLAMIHIDFAHNQIRTVRIQYALAADVCFILEGNPVSNSTDVCNGLQDVARRAQ